MVDKTQLEQKELDSLNGVGVSFKINYTTYGLFGKERQRTKEYVLHEFTLATLNLISAKSIEVHINDEEMNQANGLSIIESARKSVVANSQQMASIVALAVLGERYWLRIPGTCTRFVRKHLFRRTCTRILHSMTPTTLNQMVSVIISLSNLSDFITSTRLMSIRTTEPRSRVE